MSKDKNLKRMFDEEFDIDKMHEEILEKIEKKEKYHIMKTLKYCVPIFLVTLISAFILTNKNSSKKLTFNESNNNIDEIYINNVDNIGATRLDAVIKDINDEALEFSILNDLDIPEDINNSSYGEVYVRGVQTYYLNTSQNYSDTRNEEYTTSSNSYNLLNNYVSNYTNISNDRSVNIAFSSEYKPLRDYYFDDIGKQSKINNVNLTIYNYEKIYMTEFNYKNINYDIETNNISENEFIDLLKSIIK